MNLNALVLSKLAEWDEKKHPRADDGKFGEGAGDAKPESKDAPKSEDKPKSEDTPKPKKPRLPRGAPTRQPAKADVSKEEAKALQEYGNVAYGRINGHLMGMNLYMSPKEIAETNESIEHIDRVMKQSTIARDMVVHRGMELVPDLVKMGKDLVGKTMDVPNYWSTSTNSGVAKGYMQRPHSVKFEISLKKGNRGLNLAHFSDRPEESEILLPRGAKYKITGHRMDGPLTVFTAEMDDGKE
jgi:hypothetical protein